MDTLDPFKFEIMTRRPGHDAVLRALEVALASPLRSVKLNAVVIKGLNDHEVLDFVEMTRDRPLSVRFIEFMPFTGTHTHDTCSRDEILSQLMPGNKWDKAKMVPSSELLSRIQTKYPAVTKASDEHNDTARNYIIPGHRGSIGFISSMSDHFCGSCNRLRLTADGQIKVCSSIGDEFGVLALADCPWRKCCIGLSVRPEGDLAARFDAAGRGRRRAATHNRAGSARQARAACGDGGHRHRHEPAHDPDRWLSILPMFVCHCFFV